ncbi:copper homeostasis periplasmic binding protein CopC [Herbaspirillum huttiense]|uniref:copper homeostasis periplasmic binding protein CopC n=1 Tax=Herbaspirillum huttiense TaxID=863372 RepID=UPI0039B10D08
MPRSVPAAVVFLSAVLLAPVQAWAHAHLERAVPDGQKPVASPSEIRLDFSEGLVLPFSHLSLAAADGHAAPLEDAVLAGQGKTLVAPFKGKLEACPYEVHWEVLSTDGHKTSGSYRFTVAP